MAKGKLTRSKSQGKRAVRGPKAHKEHEETVVLNRRSIYRILSEAIDAMIGEADSIRGVAQSLLDHSGMSAGGDAEELRAAAGVVRAHGLGMLLAVAQIIAKAERVATMGDVCASAGAP